MAASTGGVFKKEEKEEKIPKLEGIEVHLLLDVDGTLTGMAGNDAVNSPLYKEIQTDPKQFYDECTFIAEDKRIEKLREGFKQTKYQTDDPDYGPGGELSHLRPCDMKMTEGSKKFLEYWLARGAKIDCISRNVEEYIRTIMKVEGMKEETIKNINVSDTHTLGGGKEGRAQDVVKKSVDVILTADDNPRDLAAMVKGSKIVAPGVKPLEFTAEPGKFDWDDMTKKLEAEITRVLEAKAKKAQTQAP